MFHYNYRITNTVLNRHYYGTRSSKVHPKEDLGVNYFSSSLDKDFLKDQQTNPQNYKYKVIVITNTRKQAIGNEIKLHKKFDVGVNEYFYNRSKQTAIGFDTTGRKFTFTEEHKKNIGEFRTGIMHSEEYKSRMSKFWTGKRIGDGNIFYGRKHSDESIKKMSESTKEQIKRDGHPKGFKGKTHSEETIKKMSESLTGIKRSVESKAKYAEVARNRVWETVTCPHCDKSGKSNAMTRWHFDNCKQNRRIL